MDEIRHFQNSFCDYEDGVSFIPYNTSTKEVDGAWSDMLWMNINRLLKVLDKNLQRGIDRNDQSVYTGTAGIALLYCHLAVRDPQYLTKALSYVEPSLSSLKGSRFTFLCGDAGPLAIAAIIYHKLGVMDKSERQLKKLQALSEDVCKRRDTPDELLYGRAGYLYALLFVRRHIGDGAVERCVFRKVITAIFESGVRLAKDERWTSPLMYKWHDKHYLGAAHGVSGILCTLMNASEFVSEDEMQTYVKPTLDFVVQHRFPSSNYPSSLGNKTDRLVHWCHGAPGLVHVLLMGHKVLRPIGGRTRFNADVFLNEALACGDVIWERGLLKKGCGICHGTAGNAFAFLSLYQMTGDVKHLHRACKFADWCFDYDEHGCRTADRPFSLFEGLAGTIYFLASMLNPWEASFPAFQLEHA